ncbi:MAG: hypothetical protein CSA38_04435 [Flavobacteriales bacterium]|nr:MAG: hypothetical protein CSA38_04435 [Flavobacteriales bacterium]
MGNSDQKTSIVFSFVSNLGLLIGQTAYILDINKDASDEVKIEEVEKFLHNLGYDIDDNSQVVEVIQGIITTAEDIKELIEGLIDFPWGKGYDEVLHFKISDNIKEEGKDLFQTGKDLVDAIIALKDCIEGFDTGQGTILDKNFPRRFNDHLFISMLRKMEDGSLFDNLVEDEMEREALKKTTFVKSLKITLATLELFEISDTQEVNILYENPNEETAELNKLNKDKKDEDKLKKVPTKINMIHWGRFQDICTFQWGYLEEAYPMEMDTAKLLFKRLSKLIDAIGTEELMDWLNIDALLNWLKSLIENDETISEEEKNNTIKAVDDIQKEYNDLTPPKIKNDIKPKDLPSNGTTIINNISIEISNIIKEEDINLYIITPIQRVLKREGISKDLTISTNQVKKLIKEINACASEKIKKIKKKDLKEWFDLIKKAYEDDKIKVNTSDFDLLATLESIKDFVLTDIIEIDDFKNIILSNLTTLFEEKLQNDYTDKDRVQKIVTEIGIEVATNFLRRFVIPQLHDQLSKLNQFIEESLKILLDLNEWRERVQEVSTDLRTLINAYRSDKSFEEKTQAFIDFATTLIDQLPEAFKNKVSDELSLLKSLYNEVETNIEQRLVSINIYHKKDGNDSIDIKLCLKLFKTDDDKVAINIYPYITAKADKDFPLGDKHLLSIATKGELNTKAQISTPIGFQISEDGISLTGNKEDVTSSLIFKFHRTAALELLNHKYISLSIGNYPQELSFELNEQFEAKYTASLENASLMISKSLFTDNGWDFVADALDDDIVASFDTTLSYSSINGFFFSGSPSLKADFDFEKSLSGLKIDGLHLALGTKTNESLNFKTLASTNLSLDISGVTFTLNNIGVKLDTPVWKDWDLSARIKYPNGIGLAIETETVKGGGFIQYNAEESKFLGVLELNIANTVELGALAILNLNVEDVPGNFSFVGLLMASGFSVPLGFNFYLVGAGGALGLNRMIDSKVVESGVHDGSLETVFLAKNLQKNITKIEKVTNQYFPIKSKQFFLGAIAKINFGSPAIVKGEMGLFIQLPSPTEIIVFGGVHVLMPEEKPSIEINVYFAGGINFEERFWFDASIRDSNIGGIDIFGDIAMRILWGKEKGVLMSAGGFHPSFEVPAKYNMPPNMQRLGMKIDKKNFKLNLGAYYAVGTNTVQFGAHLDLKADLKVAKLKGYLSFDTLFIFNPFHFETNIKAGIALSAFGVNLLAVDLDFVLSGTTPWRVKGSASVKILFWTVDADFNVSWGDKAKEIDLEVTELFTIFIEEWKTNENWKALTSDENDKLIALMDIPKESLVIHPLQGFSFKQDKIPLNQELDTYGKTLPADYKSFNLDLNNIKVGHHQQSNNTKSTKESSLFIPADFITMSNEDKLASPSFVNMDSGFAYENKEVLKGDYAGKAMEYNIDADIVEYSDSKGFSVKSAEESAIKKVSPQEIKKLIKDNLEFTSDIYPGLIPGNYIAPPESACSNSDSEFYAFIRRQQKESQSGSIGQKMEPYYRLYDKTAKKYVSRQDKKKDTYTYTEAINIKNLMLRKDKQKRSTDLVIMVE